MCVKIVWVKWRDASEELGEWTHPVETNPKGKEALIESVGSLVKEQDGFLSIAMDSCDGHVRNVGHVPISWIVERQEWSV